MLKDELNIDMQTNYKMKILAMSLKQSRSIVRQLGYDPNIQTLKG